MFREGSGGQKRSDERRRVETESDGGVLDVDGSVETNPILVAHLRDVLQFFNILVLEKDAHAINVSVLVGKLQTEMAKELVDGRFDLCKIKFDPGARIQAS